MSPTRNYHTVTVPRPAPLVHRSSSHGHVRVHVHPTVRLSTVRLLAAPRPAQELPAYPEHLAAEVVRLRRRRRAVVARRLRFGVYLRLAGGLRGHGRRVRPARRLPISLRQLLRGLDPVSAATDERNLQNCSENTTRIK